MPELDLGNWRNDDDYIQLDRIAPAIVLATMMHPNDAATREEIINTFLAATDSGPRFKKEPMVRVLNRLVSPEKPRMYGTIAGAMLVFIRTMAEQHPLGEASVNKAAFVIEARFKAEPVIEGVSWPTNRSFIMKAWTSHKCVSHLWAAMDLMYQWTAARHDNDEAINLIGKKLRDVRELSLFLSSAESMRRFGVAYKTRLGSPLLDTEAMWRVPKGYPIVENVTDLLVECVMPKLTPAEEAALAEYRAPA